MFIKSIFLENFRNYSVLNSEFSPGLNLFFGDNGQGKTNLMEAIQYPAAVRSFRTCRDRELIAHDMSRAVCEGVYLSSGRKTPEEENGVSGPAGRTVSLRSEIYAGGPRKFYENGALIRRAADFAGNVNAVVFSPDDLDMVKAGAAVRREFLDVAISQLRPRYSAALSIYNKNLAHKKRILRERVNGQPMAGALDAFNEGLAAAGAAVVKYRRAYLAAVEKHAVDIYGRISGGQEKLSLSYAVSGGERLSAARTEELKERLYDLLCEKTGAELAAGACLYGPHRDDVDFFLDGRPARAFASQGQARTIALSLKLAERNFSREDTGEYPILLLDDVLSELDAMRRDFVLRGIGDGQVFISACDRKHLDSFEGRLFRVEKGKVYVDDRL